VAPKIAVTTDSVLVEQDPSRETRRRLEERKTVPDELDSKDAKGGAALGDPTSMRSWLSCLEIVEAIVPRHCHIRKNSRLAQNICLHAQAASRGFSEEYERGHFVFHHQRLCHQAWLNPKTCTTTTASRTNKSTGTTTREAACSATISDVATMGAFLRRWA